MLKGKCVILGVTGSIAAYKTAALASALNKLGCDTHVIMTQNACHFIGPKTFETLTGNRCITDMWDSNHSFEVEHVELAKKADLIMVAPATANIIAKLAAGIADDMLTTTILASKAIKIIAPAMNTGMYENPVTQDNMDRLEKYGFQIITPATGLLACKDTGIGKMPEPEELLEHIIFNLAYPHDLEGKKVLVTAGPTREAIDPVRFISNRSTGKMGYALAKACAYRGAQVTLVSGITELEPPAFTELVPVTSAADMYQAVTAAAPDMDFIFKAAAVADFTPETVADNKIKKAGLGPEMNIALKPTQDILKALGSRKAAGQIICGFSMETENVLENSRAKLERKNADMIIANSLKEKGSGFAGDTNIITIITRDDVKSLPLDTKENLAHAIVDQAIRLSNG